MPVPDRQAPLPALELPPFQERFPWIGPHLQTVRNTLVKPRVPLPPAEIRRFPMDDRTGDVLTGLLSRPDQERGRPLAVLVHGLTGCADSFYVQGTAAMLSARGFPVLRLNLRGAGPTAADCRQRYHAGRTGDLRRVLALLAPEWADRGAVMVGYSLGGNATLKLLAEGDLPLPVRAAASVSAPIDLSACSRHFLRPANAPYHRWLLNRMKTETLAMGARLDPILRQAALAARTVWEFDDRVIAPWNGWSGAEEYYARNNALQFLPRIGVPTLVVHALDDPWIPARAYTDFAWHRTPLLRPLLPAKGGHVGFHGRTGPWHDQCLTLFFERVIG